MDTPTKLKTWLGETKKQFTWMLVAVVIGFILGSLSESNRIYSDCRYAGVTRIGHSAFKCDQFSKAVLLTPDEVVKK